MRPRKMRSKKPGICQQCNGEITPGQLIYWARGQGAWHVNCQTSALLAEQCTACKGSGRRWNNAPCPQCDGTGQRICQDTAKRRAQEHRDPVGVDMAYEDACARACGL